MLAVKMLIGKICLSIFCNCENGDYFQGGRIILRGPVTVKIVYQSTEHQVLCLVVIFVY